MKNAILTIFTILILASISSANWKDGPVVSYGPYRASGVSILVDFEPDIRAETIVNMTFGKGFELAKLSTHDGVAVFPEHFSSLKAFRGRDFSHGLVTFDPTLNLKDVLKRVKALPGIRDTFPNYMHRPYFTPNDPLYQEYQKNFKQIYVNKAWDVTKGEGVIVAVIDTGFAQTGMEDEPKNLLNGWDFWGNDGDVNDFIGHGTHVSNTVAENTNNGIGCAGIAYNSKILPCKVFPDSDSGASEDDIIDAINWSVDQGANVINMSLGGGGEVSITYNAIDNAIDNDCIVLAATGNDGWEYVSYPAAYDNCVGVGATDQHSVGADPARAEFSNYGEGLDVVAPGSYIVQETHESWVQGFYGYYGTSSACPHASGVAALMASDGGADAIAIREALEATSYNPSGKWTDDIGWGEIDAYEALKAYSSGEYKAPVAIIQAYPTVGAPPLKVFLDGTESYAREGELDSFLWKVDEKSVSEEESFDYEFTKEGLFSVILEVSDTAGKIGTDSVTITVDSESPEDTCYQMINMSYYGCDQTIMIDGMELIQSEALSACQAGQESGEWKCLLECYELVFNCDDFISCADQDCDVTIVAPVYGEDDDEDEEECSFCG